MRPEVLNLWSLPPGGHQKLPRGRQNFGIQFLRYMSVIDCHFDENFHQSGGIFVLSMEDDGRMLKSELSRA